MASELIGVGVSSIGNLWKYTYPKVKNFIKFRPNLECLRKEFEDLMNFARSLEEQSGAAERSGRVVSPSVLKWLKDLEEIRDKVNQLEAKIEAMSRRTFLCRRRLLGSEVARYIVDVKRLAEERSFPGGLVVESFEVGKVEHMPGPSILGQATASNNLAKVLNLLSDDGASIIGVWGMGGIGKTTLVKNMNNALEASDSGAHFSIIMWATASKNADLRSLQSQLLRRLNLVEKRGESMESTASRLHQRLKRENRFIFILDDVWEAIDLDYLGFSELNIGNKVVLTTRSMDVCRQMRTDVEVRVDVLNEEESWKLFIQNAGPVASLDHIKPIARKLNHECCGLPLAIIVVGASMRGKTSITLWNDALSAFQKSVPYIKGIEDKVYKPLMWSYDSLFFQGMDVKSSFLYCCLYPEDYSIEINELVQCWIGEGLIEVSDNYQNSVDRGISMVEYLKDSCLLQEGREKDTVIMHDVVRDVAIWIDSTLKDGCKSLVRPPFVLTPISEVVFDGNYKRISLIGNMIKILPDFSRQYPELSSLLLQGNSSPETPEGFFEGFPGLRVLNINMTFIEPLPISLGQLSELRSLLVKSIPRLPPLGGLLRLEVLDCTGSSMLALPEELENLSNLRLLNLSQTYHLRNIRQGIISKLTRLEILDMTDSSYMWDAHGEEPKPFDELKLLDHLSFLSIRIKIPYIRIKIPSAETVDFSWLERVKSFRLVVGRLCVEIVTQTKLDDKMVLFSEVSLCDKWVKSLFQIASCVVLDYSLGRETLQIEFAHGCCFGALKTLAILNSRSSLLPTKGVSKIDLLPNLEKLILHKVNSIESVSQLMICLGSRFSKLRTIRVSGCHNLKYLFTSSDCLPISESTVGSSTMDSGRSHNFAKASQKSIDLKLEDLQTSSTSVFGREEPWDHLEQIEVIKCFGLKKLPFTV